ncbi:hypothetical protein [Bifidobacterium sp. SO1]|uniref:hypothetical protein n=1 Tax=Bifidobacterium sp. SO1 TaxID=2809029 RepID=UPI001BDC5139|nr:hypothetical protein [Bifidobacterium sp. SO1]MBT1162178.1 hypothetical protein [Bifidobacterium sp. SO1]
MTDTNDFTFNDTITTDQTSEANPPEIDPNKVDFADIDDVCSAASYFSVPFEHALSDTVEDIVRKHEGGYDFALLTVTALTYAANRLQQTLAPVFVAELSKHDQPEWIPELLGMDDWQELENEMPDVVRVRNAYMETHATGEPVDVVLEDAGRSLTVYEKDGQTVNEIHMGDDIEDED